MGQVLDQRVCGQAHVYLYMCTCNVACARTEGGCFSLSTAPEPKRAALLPYGSFSHGSLIKAAQLHHGRGALEHRQCNDDKSPKKRPTEELQPS